eukprot:12259011-Ditylum_brightwellii.AAC.1
MHMVLNVFKKSYNKWRLEDSGVPTTSTKVKIQAMCVPPRELYKDKYEPNNNCSCNVCFISIDAAKVKPFAIIGDRGYIEPMWN